jgi:hypothetical protein
MIAQLEKLFAKFSEAEQGFWEALKPHGQTLQANKKP